MCGEKHAAICIFHFSLQSVKQLDEEANSDAQLRQQFGERWCRTSSDKLTSPIRAEASKYRQIIETAMGADHTVKNTFGQHRECIQLLSGDEVRSIGP